MKAVELTGIRQMRLADRPTPRIFNATDVLLKIEVVGVCGSDVHYYTTGKIGSQIVKYPFMVGHECSASVLEIGKGVKHLRPGDRVAVDPAMPCFECDQCKAGRENTCRKLKFLGCPGQAEGCLCEYLVMPEESLFKIPSEMSFEQAMLVEPLSIGCYAVEQSGVKPGQDIAILGCGPIGLSCMASAMHKQITNIFVTDKIDARLHAAKNFGASWTGNPTKTDIVKEISRAQPADMDVVFECAGMQETVDQAIEILKPGGRLMFIGIPEVDRISFAIDKLRRKEITIINVRRQNKCARAAIDMLSTYKGGLDFMITHRFGIEQTQQAFDLVAAYGDGVIKAMVKF